MIQPDTTEADTAVYAARVRAEIRSAESRMITTVSAALASITAAREAVAAWRDYDYRQASETDDIARLLSEASEVTVEAAQRTIQRFAY
ncbi:hypothetical protein D2E28_23560 [Mycobacteroides abscessus]|uniref:hypothetical protein n=1 Tax=Mycobacteroides abscessus TaxID=36809 RepID=UPI000E69A30D|nr:hypothetical protein [Mycobacteroides abscessus]RIR19277.1 hypothetical protein D2E28_23560 [Mycobacteroides abscessus]